MIDLFEERTNRIGFEREINEIHIEFSKFPFSKKLITANILKGFERKKNSLPYTWIPLAVLMSISFNTYKLPIEKKIC